MLVRPIGRQTAGRNRSAMETTRISFASDKDRLKTLLQIAKSDNRNHEVGTAFLPSGCRMPDAGQSIHPRHEVSIILSGRIETTVNGEMVVLKAGDIVSIPEGESQSSEVLEDTFLVYIFFDK
jgi:quercetin dioxygenase-like cupin family protein